MLYGANPFPWEALAELEQISPDAIDPVKERLPLLMLEALDATGQHERKKAYGKAMAIIE